jgi:Heparinase II/III-like protein
MQASPTSARARIESEMRVRADRYLAQKVLAVDYYRIGRRLAFPLGFERVPKPVLPVPGIPDYPWEIWMAWEIEERLNSLGWAAQWFKDATAALQAGRELEAITRWPEFTPNARLDLCLGHVARVLCQAYGQWNWLSPQTREAVGVELDRLIAQAEPWVESRYGSVRSARDVLDSPDPWTQVHNIPFIGLIGVTLAANARQSDIAPMLNGKVEVLLDVLMDLRRRGYTEAVAYDGYMLDFLSCWIQSLPAGAKEAILSRYDFGVFLNESYMLGAPGEIALVAEIADVEPRRMPFHISAQARLDEIRPDPVRAWYLSRCRIEIMRADGLAALHAVSESLPDRAAPPAGILDAQYTRVLRRGWEPNEMAVAVAASNSPAGHIHLDYGSITVGAFGKWLIADPGYQQYMPGEEREFTLGLSAHNAPVLNGQAQHLKSGKVITQEKVGDDTYKLKVDITGCYPPAVGAGLVSRSIWLCGRNLAVVADQIEGPGIESVAYHWHGDPETAWRIENGWALLYTGPSAMLWLGSPSLSISETGLDRLPGSRGQLTLSTQGKAASVIWWVFSLSESRPALEADPDGRSLTVSGRRFAP